MRVVNLLSAREMWKTAVFPHGAGALACEKLHGVAKKEFLRCNGMCTYSSHKKEKPGNEKSIRRTFIQKSMSFSLGIAFPSRFSRS